MSVSRRAGPPHFGQLVLTNSGELASGDCALPGERHVFRQAHRKLIVRTGNDAVFFAVDHGNRRAPVALARNAPIFQPISDFGRAEAFGLASAAIFASGVRWNSVP